MATLYIDEYSSIGSVSINGSGAALQGAQEPSIAAQTVAITGSSTQSAAFNAKTICIRVHTDAVCSVAMGANPVAVTTSKRMAANQTEYWPVQAGHKLAVIVNV